MHDQTLAEVLVHPYREGRASQVLATLTAIGVVQSSAQLDALTLAKTRVETGLKMPDCHVLATARHHDLGVLTFDERLRDAVG